MDQPTNRDLDAALARQVFGWVYVNGNDDGPYTLLYPPDKAQSWCEKFEDAKISDTPTTDAHLVYRVPEWSCEQIAAELMKMGYNYVVWGFSFGDGLAKAHNVEEPEKHTMLCDDESIPELERPRHALGWLALEVKGKA